MIDWNRVKGALYGQAVGDALGLATEFMSKERCLQNYPDGVTHYGQIVQDEFRGKFERGDWTDDTDQALCILESWIANKAIRPRDVANRLYEWAKGNPTDCGILTGNVLGDPDYLNNPRKVAEDVWEKSGQKSAPNGAVMRTSVVGLLRPDDLPWTAQAARSAATVTHFDPRCEASAVAVSVAIAMLVTGHDRNDAFKEAVIHASKVHPDCMEWMTKDLEDLKLEKMMGYTYKTLGAGFWALGQSKHRSDDNAFSECLGALIMEGGDADTNCAVAGSLLGAALGFAKIPSHLTDRLIGRQTLDRLLRQLQAVVVKE